MAERVSMAAAAAAVVAAAAYDDDGVDALALASVVFAQTHVHTFGAGSPHTHESTHAHTTAVL